MQAHYDICWACFPLRDGLAPLRGELALARQQFFQSGRRPVKAENSQAVKGFNGRVQGRITRRSFHWKKTAKGPQGGVAVLEEAFGRQDGWLLVFRDLRGIIVSRAFFDKAHRWAKNEYYEPWDATRPRVVFQPGEEPGQVLRRDWDAHRQAYRDTLLATAPYHPGTGEQSLVDAQFGPPQLVLATTKGTLCCCPPAEAQAREQALETIGNGTVVLMPAWEVREGALVAGDGEGEDAAITFTSLEEYAKIEPPRPSTAEEEPSPCPKEAADSPHPDSGETTGATPENSQETPTVSPTTGPLPVDSPHPDSGETSHATPEKPQETPTASPTTGPLPVDSPHPNSGETTHATPENPQETPTASPTTEPLPADSPLPDSGETTHATPENPQEPPTASPTTGPLPADSPLPDSGETTGATPEKPQEPTSTQPAGTLEEILAEAAILPSPAATGPAELTGPAPAGDITPIREGKITGRGRTQQPGGLTSYEGDYLDGKRHGFGAYYYKDGNLCYAGSWKDDRRDGLGVSFRDSDHALHVANWQEGQPQGLVTLFDKDGSLRYSGRMENGKKEGAGVMINGKDGTVFVGQWAGGEATGLGAAFDRDGRLLYYGGWKEGQRHGHGTEFDQNGSVVFDGEFREDKYYNGILYQKLGSPVAPR
ncbi:MORN repeat-containing protein [Acutalibacter caecimuris]|uniref:MORN repeat-containing protein n=1 Tax=Acutalibacter caecimuris TaxID=3093657 RepID=UPI002AC91D89|nr:hypothetical protein [Acutalibacter sp. M00118]